MSELIIDASIAERLRQIAQDEERPIEAVLQSMLDTYTVSRQPSDWPLSMAKMAEADTDIVWRDDSVDLSERSRKILDDEFADYLLKRSELDDDDST